MPYYDGTGPSGRGPRTGRGRGYCPPSVKRNQGLTGVSTTGVVWMAFKGVITFLVGRALWKWWT